MMMTTTSLDLWTCKRESAVIVLNITLFWGGWSESIPSSQEEKMLWKWNVKIKEKAPESESDLSSGLSYD